MSRRDGTSRAAAAILLALAAATIASRRAEAGAWTQPAGGGFFKIGERIARTNELFTPDGNVDRIPDLAEYTSSVYGEYGIHRRITALAYLPLVERLTLDRVVTRPAGRELSAGDAVTGIADPEVGVRFGVVQGGPTVLSVGLAFGLPLGRDDQKSGLLTGDGELNEIVTIQAGHSFVRAPVFISGEAGYNNRTRGFSDEVRWGLEIGGTLASRLTLILREREVASRENGSDPSAGGATGLYANNQEFRAVGGEALYAFRSGFGLHAGAERPFRGRNVLSETAYSAGIFWKLAPASSRR